MSVTWALATTTKTKTATTTKTTTTHCGRLTSNRYAVPLWSGTKLALSGRQRLARFLGVEIQASLEALLAAQPAVVIWRNSE